MCFRGDELLDLIPFPVDHGNIVCGLCVRIEVIVIRWWPPLGRYRNGQARAPVSLYLVMQSPDPTTADWTR